MPKSKIEGLPNEVRKSVHKLIRDGHTIDDILMHLQRLGEEISRSSVGRYKKKMDGKFKRYREAQEVAGVWVSQMGEDPKGDVGRLIAEMLKTLAFQTMADMGDDDGATAPKEIMFLAKAIKDLEGAGKLSLDRTERIHKAALKAAAKAADTVVSERGISKKDAAEIRAKILGIEVESK